MLSTEDKNMRYTSYALFAAADYKSARLLMLINPKLAIKHQEWAANWALYDRRIRGIE